MSQAGLKTIRRAFIPERCRSDRPLPTHPAPDRIVLAPRPGRATPGRAPVRLFLGTERDRFRDERLFVWSVNKYRHPGRVYEIYLLRDLAGFRRRFWPNGYHRYRYAVPEFANFSGRALYHDVGRVYRDDPARLFDQDMNGAGVLSPAPRDVSAMLLDCERMGARWNQRSVNSRSDRDLLATAERVERWGVLNGIETIAAPSRRLERRADQAKFLPFTALRPSQDWARLRLYLSSRRDGPTLQALLAPHAPDQYRDRRRISDWMERVPDPDVAWVLERLLRLTGELELRIREPLWQGGGRWRRNFGFWVERLELAGRLQPKSRWRLVHTSRPGLTRIHEGGQ